MTGLLVGSGPLGWVVGGAFVAAGGYFGGEAGEWFGSAIGKFADKVWGFFGDNSEPETVPIFCEAEKNASPIVIDLNGDGIKTISLADSYTKFDLNNNQFAEKTAWVDKNDGLLALDLNGNGRIDNGAELFGIAKHL